MNLSNVLSPILQMAADDGDTGGNTPEDRGDSVDPAVADLTPEVTDADPMQKGEPEEPEAEPKKDDEPRIPKAEFDRRIARERDRTAAAEARAATAEQAAVAANHGADLVRMEQDIVSMEAKHAQLLLDGETEKAALLVGEIRRAERQIALTESSRMSVRAKEMAKEEIRFEATIEQMESVYPVLDPKTEDYSQDLVDEVLMMKEGYEARGMAASAALKKAVGYVMRGTEAPKAADEPKGLGAKDDKGGTRKAAQVAKNVDTAARQPAKTAGVGLDTDKTGSTFPEDAESMTQEEFAALPDSARAKMRGDAL